MSLRRRFAQVDVFTSRPFHGNPLAVVLDAEGLSAAEMQRIAHWTNLSEAVFVLPPSVAGADYQARIFAREAELPFAGHPTLGTARAVLDAGIAAPRKGQLTMQCAAGIVPVTVDGDHLSFRLPGYTVEPARGAAEVPHALGVPSAIGEIDVIDTGPRWLVARVPDVGRLAPDAVVLQRLIAENRASGITTYSEVGAGEIEARTLFFVQLLIEDPVCGSGNAAVAVHRLRAGRIADGDHYLARQGRHVGRDGEIRVRVEAGGVHIGGQCVRCMEGVLVA